MRADVTGAWVLGFVLGVCLPAGTAAAENNAGDAESRYGASLSRVYLAHQRLLAVRDACARAFPAQEKTGEKAYATWQARHRGLLNELDTRVTMMIRGSSKDERDYMRNIGKYEGSILEYRNGERDDLLAQPRDGMEQGCADFRNYLVGPGSDFNREYAEELRVLRQRRLPK